MQLKQNREPVKAFHALSSLSWRYEAISGGTSKSGSRVLAVLRSHPPSRALAHLLEVLRLEDQRRLGDAHLPRRVAHDDFDRVAARA